MKKQEVEVYSDASNFVVLRHPGRNFSGSLIQGDSLYILLQDIREAKEELDCGNNQNASEILDGLIKGISDRLEHYKEVLKAHGHELPFAE